MCYVKATIIILNTKCGKQIILLPTKEFHSSTKCWLFLTSEIAISRTLKQKTIMPGKIKSCALTALIFLCINNPKIFSQQFSAAVKKFISVNADTIVLIHATVIDGTGAPARSNQTIIIIKGKTKMIAKKMVVVFE